LSRPKHTEGAFQLKAHRGREESACWLSPFPLLPRNCMQSSLSSLSRTGIPPRLRLKRNPTLNNEQDSEFLPTPSSSSASSHRNMIEIDTAPLGHIARASSSADSQAARLRALTSRVLANTSSQATPAPTDPESDAATFKKSTIVNPSRSTRVFAGELESDIESLVGNSLSPQHVSAKQKLRDLYMRTLAASEADETPKAASPRRRRSFTSPESPRSRQTARRSSLSDNERDRKITGSSCRYKIFDQLTCNSLAPRFGKVSTDAGVIAEHPACQA